jgi:hypothetical protein
MFLYLSLAFIIVVIPNFMLINRSKRKKRYGIFPLYVTSCMVLVLLIFEGVIHLTLHSTPQPSMSSFAKLPHAIERFNDADSEYQRDKADDDDRLEHTAPLLSIGLKILKVQLFISLGFILFALLTISGRNNFYYSVLLINLLCLSTAFLLDKGIV